MPALVIVEAVAVQAHCRRVEAAQELGGATPLTLNKDDRI
jgi:hypothetical protein